MVAIAAIFACALLVALPAMAFAGAGEQQPAAESGDVAEDAAPVWTLGSGEEFSVGFVVPENVTSFTGVQVDGGDVPEGEYSASEDGSLVTLQASYLETLGEGEHTASLVFAEGAAFASFAVQTEPGAAAVAEDEVSEPQPTTEDADTEAADVDEAVTDAAAPEEDAEADDAAADEADDAKMSLMVEEDDEGAAEADSAAKPAENKELLLAASSKPAGDEKNEDATSSTTKQRSNATPWVSDEVSRSAKQAMASPTKSAPKAAGPVSVSSATKGSSAAVKTSDSSMVLSIAAVLLVACAVVISRVREELYPLGAHSIVR